ncbi:MAG: hypothetical protein UV68_C0009G0002 [Candidatus Collierbacteria bacterium GW2011_GWC2_43_12]|uniref:Uncharacterized protein n=1 Tax=Candidatus Collierbacteria bacterium GW2011_GWC2_43_12 TaxID=1618390 RepID=A0A0G1G6A6_9BACT|nr:MAG: hypothetical protein UV68_C0009G0002 [Candidatus Collierbacteria bacterium GW2011_GWC2_43_12]
MPILGKEAERQLTPDEIALQEIQGYIDRVERQAETQQPQAIRPQQTQMTSQSLQGPSVQVAGGVVPVSIKSKITLPLDQREIESGLKKNVLEGLRWLSEWCIMMIKKYPGRVFYMPPSVNK